VLGEIFVVIELCNLDIEKKLGQMRVEVRRGVWLSDWLNDRSGSGRSGGTRRHMQKKLARGNLNYPAGGESIETVGKTLLCQKKGVDACSISCVHLHAGTCRVDHYQQDQQGQGLIPCSP